MGFVCDKEANLCCSPPSSSFVEPSGNVFRPDSFNKRTVNFYLKETEGKGCIVFVYIIFLGSGT